MGKDLEFSKAKGKFTANNEERVMDVKPLLESRGQDSEKEELWWFEEESERSADVEELGGFWSKGHLVPGGREYISKWTTVFLHGQVLSYVSDE